MGYEAIDSGAFAVWFVALVVVLISVALYPLLWRKKKPAQLPPSTTYCAAWAWTSLPGDRVLAFKPIIANGRVKLSVEGIDRHSLIFGHMLHSQEMPVAPMLGGRTVHLTVIATVYE